jgi:hypothetical protein
MTNYPVSGGEPEIMGGPEPGEQAADLMGGAGPGGDIMGKPDPDEQRTDLMGGHQG